MALRVFGVIVRPASWAPEGLLFIRAMRAAVLGDGGKGAFPPPTKGVKPVAGVRPVRGVKPVRGVRPDRKSNGRWDDSEFCG